MFLIIISSNHALKKNADDEPTVGAASGIFYMPAVGDTVVCGFRRCTISIENRVEALFIAAPTELINAASSPPTTKPLNPTGSKVETIVGKTISPFMVPFSTGIERIPF